MRRTAILPALIVSALAAGGTLTTAPPAVAAPTGATSWAAFAQPDGWANQADNLHWYVATPTITRAQAGRASQIRLQTSRVVDCENLGLGYTTPTGWASVEPMSMRCSPSGLTTTFVVPNEAVGTQIQLSGWSQVSARTDVTVRGTITMDRRTSTTSVTAHRDQVPQPVGPLQALGMHGRRSVSLASHGGLNEIWVGGGRAATRYSAPGGTPFHAELAGSRVFLWLDDDSSMILWTLDLTSGHATTTQWRVEWKTIGKRGVWLVTSPAAGQSVPTGVLLDWHGTTRFRAPAHTTSYHDRFMGFTDDAAVFQSGGMVPTSVFMKALDSDTTAASGGIGLSIQIRPDGVVVRTQSGPDAYSECLLTLAGTCTPLP